MRGHLRSVRDAEEVDLADSESRPHRLVVTGDALGVDVAEQRPGLLQAAQREGAVVLHQAPKLARSAREQRHPGNRQGDAAADRGALAEAARVDADDVEPGPQGGREDGVDVRALRGEIPDPSVAGAAGVEEQRADAPVGRVGTAARKPDCDLRSARLRPVDRNPDRATLDLRRGLRCALTRLPGDSGRALRAWAGTARERDGRDCSGRGENHEPDDDDVTLHDRSFLLGGGTA